MQILCNDPEEREHIKHLLLKSNIVLAFENDHKRYFSKFTKEDEKENFKLLMKHQKKTLTEKGLYSDEHHDEVLRKIK